MAERPLTTAARGLVVARTMPKFVPSVSKNVLDELEQDLEHVHRVPIPCAAQVVLRRVVHQARRMRRERDVGGYQAIGLQFVMVIRVS